MEKNTAVFTEEATKYRGCDVSHLEGGKKTGNTTKQATTVTDHGSYFIVEQAGTDSITSKPLTIKFGNAVVSDPSQPIMFGKGTGPYSQVYSIYYKEDEIALTFDCRKASLLAVE
ncbi:hypothetical protein [Enterobacter ludwigii]|uniref:hypothetical protein n=1 Tax=Enterobacter ludwigii TaxID=299767 RepID=UPI0039769C8E|nr:hypothetical protein [Klebsiella sp. T2.Ur]MCL6723248.1 hypothetical protein [Klebsiella sp. T2.Ur]